MLGPGIGPRDLLRLNTHRANKQKELYREDSRTTAL